jgi:hypothetical protein
MNRFRRKRKYCLNCGRTLGDIYNFCPNCGQENDDKAVDIRLLLKDFFSNAFAFDSKFFSSIKPFLFKPGYLTQAYSQGKRMSYVNPIRLYLVISLFYFIALSSVIKQGLYEDPQVNFMTSDSVNRPMSLDSALIVLQDSIDRSIQDTGNRAPADSISEDGVRIIFGEEDDQI